MTSLKVMQPHAKIFKLQKYLKKITLSKTKKYDVIDVRFLSVFRNNIHTYILQGTI